jgi:hypothetical protein
MKKAHLLTWAGLEPIAAAGTNVAGVATGAGCGCGSRFVPESLVISSIRKKNERKMYLGFTSRAPAAPPLPLPVFVVLAVAPL